MAHTETAFDALLELARDVDITSVAGKLWPPMEGRMWIGGRELADLLLPGATKRFVAPAIVPGGPPREVVHVGDRALDSEGLDRLARHVADAGGHVYRARLERLSPAEWLARYGDPAPSPLDPPPPGPGHWRDDPEGAEVRGTDTGPTVERAKAAGWPANLGDYPTLFLDGQPLFNLLATENVGRDVLLLVGDLAEQG